MFDVVTIGSATLDVFIESDSANIVSVSSKDKRSDFMSFPYGSKVEIDDFSRNLGGGGINTAMNFAHFYSVPLFLCLLYYNTNSLLNNSSFEGI